MTFRAKLGSVGLGFFLGSVLWGAAMARIIVEARRNHYL